MREPNAIIGDNLSPQETNANNGVREQGAERISCCWELSGYLWGEGGVRKGCTPGSEPRRGRLEVSAQSGRSQTGTDDLQEASHQESTPGLREELQLMNQRKTSHTIGWKAFSHCLAGGAQLLPWTHAARGPGWGSASAPRATRTIPLRTLLSDAPVLFRAVSHPQQSWVLKKPSWSQRGLDPGHPKHFLLLFFT